MLEEEIVTKARAFFKNITITRRWNAEHGGVYVKKRTGVESNPYLENPDIVTPEGQLYTLRNPAAMTREISEYARLEGLFSYHITSLKLKNPNNAPDEFEKVSLTLFETGQTENFHLTDRRFFYMAPLLYEKSCEKCHYDMGYSIGQIRGGISVTFTIDEVITRIKNFNLFTLLLSASFCTLLILLIYVLIYRFASKLEEDKSVIISQNNRLEELNRKKNEFLGIAAHDLRNPISAILSLTGFLVKNLENIPRDDMRHIFKTMNSSSSYMSNLLNDILDVTKIETGKLSLVKKMVDYRDYIMKVIRINKILAEKRDISLILQCPEYLPRIALDQNRITQVLNNLIGNSLKYSESGTKIKILIERDNHYLITKISDQGQGIPEEDLSKIFSAFQSGSLSGKSVEKSYGLGLAISRRMIEAHQGILGVESKMHLGSTFYFKLPLDAKPDEQL